MVLVIIRGCILLVLSGLRKIRTELVRYPPVLSPKPFNKIYMYVLLFLSPPRTKKQRKEAALGACVINAIDGLLNYILMTSFLHLLRLSLEVLYTIISYNKNKKYLFRCLARIAFSS